MLTVLSLQCLAKSFYFSFCYMKDIEKFLFLWPCWNICRKKAVLNQARLVMTYFTITVERHFKLPQFSIVNSWLLFCYLLLFLFSHLPFLKGILSFWLLGLGSYGFNLQERSHWIQRRGSNPGSPSKKPPLCHLSYRPLTCFWIPSTGFPEKCWKQVLWIINKWHSILSFQ